MRDVESRAPLAHPLPPAVAPKRAFAASAGLSAAWALMIEVVVLSSSVMASMIAFVPRIAVLMGSVSGLSPPPSHFMKSVIISRVRVSEIAAEPPDLIAAQPSEAVT